MPTIEEDRSLDAPPLVNVVDDDAPVLRALSRLLRSWGMRVRTFSSGEAFLAAVCHAPVADCLVLDVQMPGINGLEVQQRLKATGLNLPIIFITGHEVEGTEERAMQAGAFCFLRKPFSDDLMVTMIRRSLPERELPARVDAHGAQNREG
jgi:FixJ family two-component response regulator